MRKFNFPAIRLILSVGTAQLSTFGRGKALDKTQTDNQSEKVGFKEGWRVETHFP